MTEAMKSGPDALLRMNIAKVFNERDAGKRLAGLQEAWIEQAIMYEAGAVLKGHQAISDAVDALHSHLPQGTHFRPLAPAIMNHDAAMLRWEAISGAGERVVTGTDLAFIEDGRIATLYVFLDTPSQG